jgi:superfamily II DNA helicase RecQ
MPALALLTATATSQVRNDIRQIFQQQSLSIHSEIDGGTHRDNLTYKVVPVNGNKDLLIVDWSLD